MGLGKGLVGQVGEGRAAPERERVAKLLRARLRLGAAGALDDDPKAVEIELARPDAQPISRSLRLQHLGPEGLSQLRDEVLQRRRRSSWRLLAPERVDQPVDRDDPARFEQEHRQHRPLFQAAEQERACLVGDLEWTENSKIRHVTFVTPFRPPEQASTPE